MFIKFNTQLVNLQNVFCFDISTINKAYLITCQDVTEVNFLNWSFKTKKERDEKFAELEKKLLGE